MKKNRYILCLLVSAFLLYFAVPRFSIFADGLAGTFAITWLIFVLFVIAGNLSALLYSPKKRAIPLKKQKNKKVRYLGH
ncbi:hypothetical protein [Pseudoneobacillus sp. C159]